MKTLGDAYQLPRIYDGIASLVDAIVFTTLECKCGYCQVPVTPEGREKTTFVTHCGTCRYTWVLVVRENAPATFS